jgi:hypothetical protein
MTDTSADALAAVRAARADLLEAKRYVRPKPAVARGLVAKAAATLDTLASGIRHDIGGSGVPHVLDRLADNLVVADRDMLACPSMALGYVEGALWELANLQRRLGRGGAAAAEGG